MMYQGNAENLHMIESGSVQCVVTSPPYWGQRAYGDSDQELGIEDLLDYARRMTVVFNEVWRVLHPTGVVWLIIGDTAAGSGGAGGDHTSGGKQHIAKYKQADPVSLFPFFEKPNLLHESGRWVVGRGKIGDGSWCMVPALLAWHLMGAGWLIRKEIVWDKQREARESLAHVRRPRSSHESVFMLTKSMKYKFHAERLKETGDVWHFRSGGTRKGHPAPFPNELAERCIVPSTDAGDIVLDPFAGSGTVPTVASLLGRVGIGVDLYYELNKVVEL